MEAFLIVMLCIMSYAMVGGASFARHTAIANSRCRLSEHYSAYDWCAHSMLSLWAAGVFWPVGLPLLIGVKAGGTTKENRDEARRARELAEADHKIVLAKKRAEETRMLEQALD